MTSLLRMAGNWLIVVLWHILSSINLNDYENALCNLLPEYVWMSSPVTLVHMLMLKCGLNVLVCHESG